MRVALAQINPTVGDVDGNAAKIAAWIERARAGGAELAIFPELCIPGYPAEDLYLKRHFLAANVRAVERLAAGLAPGITVLVGFAEPAEGGGDYRHAHNSLAVLADGAVQRGLPQEPPPQLRRLRRAALLHPRHRRRRDRGRRDAGVGLTICEDTWAPGPPGQAEADAGARLIANPSGSPYHRGKGHEREEMFGERAREYGAYFAFVNLVGGQDELVFDGQSLLLGARRRACWRGRRSSRRSCCSSRCRPTTAPRRRSPTRSRTSTRSTSALVLGLRDYVEKNGFGHVGLGISGGIDSALVAMLAVDALGPERVTLVVMPSPHSSAETQDDARQIARNLGTELIDIPIEPMMDGYRDGARPAPAARRRGRRRLRRRPDPTLGARPRRREHPGADPRQPDDGALQPARLAGADDRQQERDVGRLRDPLRRHGGRLRGDQGRAEDARLRAGRTAQRTGRDASWCPPR